jgi:hypothetical protein
MDGEGCRLSPSEETCASVKINVGYFNGECRMWYSGLHNGTCFDLAQHWLRSSQH